MQQTKPIQLDRSTLCLAYTIFKPLRIKRKIGLFEKNHGRLFSGKMSERDVDFARYLIHKGKRKYNICEFFGIDFKFYSQISDRSRFDKHLSPFEKLINGCYPIVDNKLIESYEIKNDLLIKYYNSYKWRSK